MRKELRCGKILIELDDPLPEDIQVGDLIRFYRARLDVMS